ncbi:sensor histidine kinase [Alloiococcus sp. CFN-8]|uniref:sensor histidine kinase n=1 Tax=Alloiococcus sp. CFN-8 TaxID=3416081 RepID=UPI003CF00785
MGLFRNKEIVRILFINIAITFVAAVIGFFLRGGLFSILIVAFSSIIIAVNLFNDYKRYRRISELGQEIDGVLHGKENIDFTSYEEGELAILSSEIQKMTIRLREQREALQQDKLYLADSIADISHQLRTPLTSMNLITSLLSKSELSLKERRELVSELSGLLGRIDWLVASLLKISRLDAGTVEFKREKVKLKDLIKRSSEPIAVAMDLREQRLIIDIQEEAEYLGDIHWSSEALGNIIKNSVEHTPSGGEIYIKGSENTIYTEIIIEDNGKGIDPEDIPHLFERFYRGKNSSPNSIGIGLALARMIVTEQNGTIKVENRREGGARFIIRFYKGII